MKIILEQSNFLKKFNLFNYKEIVALEEIFSQLILRMVNLFFQSYTICLNFYFIFTCVDPDPHSEYGSGSTKILNTYPILIWIHNTGFASFFPYYTEG